MARDGQITFNGTIVDCPEITHVVRRGVLTQAFGLQPIFVCQHKVGIEIRHIDIPAVTEKTDKTVERCRVGAANTVIANIGQMDGKSACEGNEADVAHVCTKKGHHTVGVIRTSAAFETSDDFFKPEKVTPHFRFNH